MVLTFSEDILFSTFTALLFLIYYSDNLGSLILNVFTVLHFRYSS